MFHIFQWYMIYDLQKDHMWHKIRVDETLDGWNIIMSIVKKPEETNFWHLMVVGERSCG
jgi:hypothetical protein